MIWCIRINVNKRILLTINSFIFRNDVTDVFDVDMIFVLIAFVVDLVMKSEVYRREDDIVMDII